MLSGPSLLPLPSRFFPEKLEVPVFYSSSKLLIKMEKVQVEGDVSSWSCFSEGYV